LPNEFEQVMYSKRKTSEQKEMFLSLNYFLNKAESTLKSLPVFSFNLFEENYLEQRNTHNSVSFAFEKYIKQLNDETRIGTAVSYQCAKNSLEAFCPNLTFADVSPIFLKKYESWMLQNKKSLTTIGIYLRSFRSIYNMQGIDKSLYPFGATKDKYTIPTGRNIKKALTVDDIALIYRYEATPFSTKDMAKDYWLFLYLCNGMNVKDFCLLKWDNINGNMLTYTRAKTKRSSKTEKTISVAIKPQTLDIIKKWGRNSTKREDFIFPHLNNEMSEFKKRSTFQQLTKIVNKYMKQIASELDLNKEVTTYFARHSFATVLKRSGADVAMISELLGHSSLQVTESYLDSFENEHIQKQTDVLTVGF
jgi:integrase